MLRRVLDPQAERQRQDAKALLAELRDALIEFSAAPDDQAVLARSIAQLDEFFLLVVVGEFNAGKSAFINALLGKPVLAEGVTPTTTRVQLLKYGTDVTQQLGTDGVLVVTAPADFLQDVHIVDTPGTNAIIREHERLTTEFVPRADLVFFVSSADRPFTESERAFLEMIRGWGKKIVIVLNKVDIFHEHGDLDRVLAFVTDAAQRLLGDRPEVFPVSARIAFRAKQGDPALWAASRFEALERYVRESLDDRMRFQLKLSNPLGVAQTLAGRYTDIARERLTLLERDVTLIEDIDRQLRVYKDDLARGFELRITAVEKVLVDMEARGHRYFENTLRIGRVVDLLNRARVQKEFEDQVIGDAPRLVEQRVGEAIDWMVDQDFRQWQGITARLAERTAFHQSRLLGAPEVGSFHAERTQLIDSVGREAQRVVETYDQEREAQGIADQARMAVATAAAVGASALGLGALVTVAATTAAADVTGLLTASLIAALGFLVIPARRRRAKAEMQEKITALRARLTSALRAEFERAQTHSIDRIAAAVAPYSRFVRAEETRWRTAERTLRMLADRCRMLADSIARPGT